MKPLLALVALGLLALGAHAADDAAATVKAAARKLAEKPSYAWTSTPKNGGPPRARLGPTEGKVGKDGWMHTRSTMGDSEVEVLRRGERGAVKREGEWRTLADLEETERGAWFARRIRNFKAPAVEAGEMAANTRGLAPGEDGAYAGQLTEEAARNQLSWGVRRPDSPGVRNAKGSVKFWIRDGLLSKYEYTVSGTFQRPDNNEEMTIERTVTVEIRDVGKAEVTVPDAVKQKLS